MQIAGATRSTSLVHCIRSVQLLHLTSSTLKMAAVRAICPAMNVANSRFCVLSMMEPGTEMETVHGLPLPLRLRQRGRLRQTPPPPDYVLWGGGGGGNSKNEMYAAEQDYCGEFPGAMWSTTVSGTCGGLPTCRSSCRGRDPYWTWFEL